MEYSFNERDVFLDIVNFKPSKRTLKWEFGYLSLTAPRWYREGLPRKDNKTPTPEILKIIGQSFPVPFNYGNEFDLRERDDVSTYFKMDEGIMGIPVKYWMYPLFEKKILYEDNKYLEFIDAHGV
ncbi:unnamed protein product, partial [marine sediment metagenome]